MKKSPGEKPTGCILGQARSVHAAIELRLTKVIDVVALGQRRLSRSALSCIRLLYACGSVLELLFFTPQPLNQDAEL